MITDLLETSPPKTGQGRRHNAQETVVGGGYSGYKVGRQTTAESCDQSRRASASK